MAEAEKTIEHSDQDDYRHWTFEVLEESGIHATTYAIMTATALQRAIAFILTKA